MRVRIMCVSVTWVTTAAPGITLTCTSTRCHVHLTRGECDSESTPSLNPSPSFDAHTTPRLLTVIARPRVCNSCRLTMRLSWTIQTAFKDLLHPDMKPQRFVTSVRITNTPGGAAAPQ